MRLGYVKSEYKGNYNIYYIECVVESVEGMCKDDREVEEIEIVERSKMYKRLNILGDKYICKKILEKKNLLN